MLHFSDYQDVLEIIKDWIYFSLPHCSYYWLLRTLKWLRFRKAM